MSTDGPEQREAERLEREIQGGSDIEVAEQLADETRDVAALSAPEINIAAQIDRLGASAITIRMQRDSLADILRDIAMGAEMMLQQPEGFWPSSIRHYFEELKRVARAGLKEAGV